ncbi:hypothetical protein [Nocardioides daejeonensis]|uniref:hypothetical protein n=1 Tax=Nocardioides daejeonensis TaxID=1046556 RepID=UPI000D742A68|nr:hypothetical protein [Nocardioides daejeonensis]
MVRRYAVSGVVCAAALVLAPGLTAATALVAGGEPIPVAAARAEAATATPGLHLLSLPGDGWLRVERDPGSTVWVGESVVTARPNNGEYRLSFHDTDHDCSWTGPDSVGEYLAQVRLRTGGTASGTCSGDELWVRHRLSRFAQYADTPVTVAVWEEPAPTSKELPGPSRTVAWDGSGVDEVGSVLLGATFAEAPELEGRYTVSVAPGVPALFAVPLDWGQHVQVELSLPDGNTEKAPAVTPRLINPLGMTATWADSTASRSGTAAPERSALSVLTGVASRAGVVSPTIRWRNRDAPANAAAFPGRYYVALDMEVDGPEAESAGATFEVAVKVVTDEEAEAPYADAPPLPDLREELTVADERAAVSEKASTSASAQGDRPWPAAVGLLTGSAVCALAGALLLGRWRRGVLR